MRTIRAVLSTLLLAGAFCVAAAAQPPAPALVQPALNAALAVGVGVQGRTVGVDFFYSNLAPYGYWVNRPSYGWAWVPRHISHGWRPYTQGRWVYSDYGWTWVSAEPFGWATYHYGRWYLDPDYGWEWTPGTDWGPAWVSWQEGDGYLGWAPLPPQVGFTAGVGLDLGGFNLGVGIDPGWYCFAPERSFLAVNVGAVVVPSFRNAEIFRNTSNVTNYRFEGGRVFNNAVAADRISQVTGQPVHPLRFAAAGAPGRARVSGGSVAMFRPAAVVRNANTPDPTRVAPRSVATGRVAQQLVQERHGMAATQAARTAQASRTAPGARTANVQESRRAAAQRSATARTAQASTAHRTSAVARSQGEARVHNQPATANRQASRSATQRSAPRGTATARARRPVTPAARTHQPPPRGNHPAPQAQHQVTHRTPPQTPGRRQQAAPARRQSSPPPQHQARAEETAQARGHAPAPAQHQAPPPRAERQSSPPPPHQASVERRPSPPPQRQAQAAAPRPAPQQRQAHAQPPPQRQGQGRPHDGTGNR